MEAAFKIKFKFKRFMNKVFHIGKSPEEQVKANKDLEKTRLIPVRKIQNITDANQLKSKILKKHRTLTNVNVGLKIFMIAFTFACMIFFAVVSSGGITTDKYIRHLIGVGHLVFIWPTITAGVILFVETFLFVWIYNKRKWIHLHNKRNELGQFTKLKKLSTLSIIFYSVSLIFAIAMFSYWFDIIGDAYGSFQNAFKDTFDFYIPEIGDFKILFIILSSIMMATEAAIIATLIAIRIHNKKYWNTFLKILPDAQIRLMKSNKRF